MKKIFTVIVLTGFCLGICAEANTRGRTQALGGGSNPADVNAALNNERTGINDEINKPADGAIQMNTPPQTRTVLPPPMQSSADRALNQRVLTELRQQFTSYSPIPEAVYSQNGVVTLQGTVSSRLEAERLAQAAAKVYGVMKVNNNLIVEPSATNNIKK